MKNHSPRCAAVCYRAGGPLFALSFEALPLTGADVLDALAALKAVRTRLRLARDVFEKAMQNYEAAAPVYEPIVTGPFGLLFMTLDDFERKTEGLDWRKFPPLVDGRAKLVARAEQEAAAIASSGLDGCEADYHEAMAAESKAVACVIAAELKCPAGALALLEFAAVDCDLGNVSAEQTRALQAAIGRAAAILAARVGIARPAHSA